MMFDLVHCGDHLFLGLEKADRVRSLWGMDPFLYFPKTSLFGASVTLQILRTHNKIIVGLSLAVRNCVESTKPLYSNASPLPFFFNQ